MLSTIALGNAKPIAISARGDVVYLDSDISKKKNEVDVPNLQILPNVDKKREVVYIAGPSGSGKSILAKNYAKQYQTLYPKHDVFIFSKVRDDESLQGIKDPLYIDIDDSLVTAPINVMEECKDCLIIFDDIDTVSIKDQSLALTAIMMDVLECGRHNNISCIITSHLINGLDRKRTRTILNECHRVVIFPRATSAYSINYFLKNYIGILNKKTYEKIQELPSRWVAIFRNFPQHIIHSQGALML